GCVAASPTSSPKVTRLPEGCATTPSLTVTSDARTDQRCAAAATSIARAVAPASRNCCHELAIGVEPRSPRTSLFGSNARLPYVGSFDGTASARICFQDAPNSSASTAERPVHTRRRTSTCLQINVTVLSGLMRTRGVAADDARRNAPNVSPEP